MASDIYDRLYGELRNAERKWSDAVSNRFGSGGILTTTGGGNGLTSGLVSVFGGSGRPSGVIRALAGNENVQRLNNVLNAINESFPAAFSEITKKLRGVSIDAIKPILRDMLTDVALYLGGSTVLGAGIGGGIGSLGFGVGAVPGAMVGGWLGFEIGNIIMALTGLKSVVVFMKDAVPAAVKCYGIGFKNAWGEDPTDTAPWKHSASRDIAMGHILFMMALLMGIVAYLTRGNGNFGKLLAEVRASPKLGPKMAEWLEANQADLLRNPELQPKAIAGSGGSAGDAAPPPSSSISPPTRGQNPETLAKVNKGKAPYSELNASVAEINGYQRALDRGEIGIMAPGKASAPGVDYATFDPVAGEVIISDAKYRGPGGTYPTSIPDAKLADWTDQVKDVVSGWADSPQKTQILNALDNGRVRGEIFPWP
jgi:hypothetical protein